MIAEKQDLPKLKIDDGTVVACEGEYQEHIQGMDTDGEYIYWSFAKTLVKTDAQGKLVKSAEVPYHHGDPCVANNRLYVPYGFGSWNKEIGDAESKNYIYVYDTDLNLIDKKHVPELIYGAGCIEFVDGKFFIGGGLPAEKSENYIYEYSKDFEFIQRHTLDFRSKLGIQTIKFADNAFWLGAYGSPNFCVKTDRDFKIQKTYNYPTTVGLIYLGTIDEEPRFLVAWHIFDSIKKTNKAKAITVKVTADEIKKILVDKAKQL